MSTTQEEDSTPEFVILARQITHQTKETACEKYTKAYNTVECITEYAKQAPDQITNWKNERILSQNNLNERHMALCLSTLGVAAFTLRFHPRVLSVLRNTLVTYMGLGVFLTPEIHNPYLRWR